jgi:hypothetical protein
MQKSVQTAEGNPSQSGLMIASMLQPIIRPKTQDQKIGLIDFVRKHIIIHTLSHCFQFKESFIAFSCADG